MLRTRLLSAVTAVALMSAGAAFAQDGQAQEAVTPLPTQNAPQSETMPAATVDASATTSTSVAATPAEGGTVIDTLKSQGQFSVLLTALDAAQLTDTLKSQPAISIFAPTDAAFAALSEADRTRLMDPANVNELRQVLLYHVIVADVNSSQIKGTKGGVETAARSQVQLDGTGASIMIDNATVTTADISASNGAVFAIDKVLNPATSAVASGDAEDSTVMEEAEPMAPEPMTPVAPATPAPMASPDPVATPEPDMASDMSAPVATPPVAATEQTAEPVEDAAETPVTPPTAQ